MQHKLLQILGFILAMAGIATFYTGFHNHDLALNFEGIACKYGLKDRPQLGADGRTTAQIYYVGTAQLQAGMAIIAAGAGIFFYNLAKCN